MIRFTARLAYIAFNVFSLCIILQWEKAAATLVLRIQTLTIGLTTTTITKERSTELRIYQSGKGPCYKRRSNVGMLLVSTLALRADI